MSLQILMFKATRLEVLCIYVTLISIDSWQLVRGRINRREYKCGRSRQSGEARRLKFLPASRRILSQWLGSKRGGASMLSHSKRGRERTRWRKIQMLYNCVPWKNSRLPIFSLSEDLSITIFDIKFFTKIQHHQKRSEFIRKHTSIVIL